MNSEQMSDGETGGATPVRRKWPDYGSVWRWHFYAGVFCIPFVIVLSITGTIYLFRPQIESWQERSFDRLSVDGEPASLPDQIQAAVHSVAGGVFASCELPKPNTRTSETGSATRVIVDQDGERVRVYVDPIGPKVLHSVVESERFIRVVRRIHGELLLGKRGSYLVELAASWTIFMVVTGMVLWLPRDLRLAGVVYPRLNKPGKTFWKDIHSVGGFWGSGLIVFLIATGLPWLTFWGDYFKWVRTVTGTAVKVQHWEGGHENHSPAATSLNGEEVSKISQLVYAKPKNTKQLDAARNSEQQIPGQISGQSPRAAGGPSWRSAPPDPNSYQLVQITSVAAFADTTAMQSPVLLLPPTAADSVWTVKSETANRPYRQTIRYDAVASRVIDRESFSDQHWVNQVVGQGIALHEGQRFGLINQLIALLATVTLIMLSMTGIILWWRRRDGPGLSPPAMNASATDKGAITPSRVFMLAAIGIALSIYLPIFGASLVSVLLLDRFVLMRIKPLARWLGLQ